MANLLICTRVYSAVKDTQNLSHVHLATEILVALYESDRTCMLFTSNRCFTSTYRNAADQQKSLCQLLGQLDIERGPDSKSILKLNVLLSHHEEVLSHHFFFLYCL